MTTIELNGVTAKERLTEIMQALEQGVKDVFTSGRYQDYLTLMSRFHHYSFRNVLLILSQMPEATRVAGIGTWNRMSRRVIAGSKGLRILAPNPIQNEEWIDVTDASGNPIHNPDTGRVIQTKVIQTLMSFKVVSVFDVSQTEGPDLPRLATELEGDLADNGQMLEAVRRIAGCPVIIRALKGKTKANGYYAVQEKEIVIRAGMSDVQTLKTAVHELAHSRIHAKPRKTDDGNSEPTPWSRHAIEVEAESVAFVACSRFGIATDDYSFGYIAGWSKDASLPELQHSLAVIQATAEQIIEELARELKALQAAAQPEPAMVV